MEEEELKGKAKKLFSYLLVQRHSQPGCKGWELKRLAGKNYQEILKIVSIMADEANLKLVVVPDEEQKDDMDKARYVFVSKDAIGEKEGIGWMRIEEAASLAIILSQLYVKGTMESKKAIQTLLLEKLPAWRIKQIIAKLTRLGYIEEDAGYIKIGWRSKVEVDRDELLTSILSKAGKEASQPS
ncbi:MAG: hypothetical protein QXT39_05585 [Conexivisphaerales archaeon]